MYFQKNIRRRVEEELSSARVEEWMGWWVLFANVFYLIFIKHAGVQVGVHPSRWVVLFEVDEELDEGGFFGEVEFLAEAVACRFNAAHGQVGKLGYVFCREV